MNEGISKTNYFIILLIASLPPFAANIYLPSLPIIAESFAAPAHIIKLSIAFYILGLGISYLWYGPISDEVGRRKPILFGISTSIIGSALCYFSIHLSVFMLGRFIQGISLGACGALGRAAARDLTSGNHLAKFSSQIAMVSTFIMATSPLLGSYLHYFWGWRSIFLFLIFYTLFVWFFIFSRFNETFSPKPEKKKIHHILNDYKIILTNREFVTNIIISCCAYSCLISYYVTTPFIYLEHFQFTPIQFGWLTYLVAIAIFTSAFINSKLVMNYGLIHMIRSGTVLMVITIAIMLIYVNFININVYHFTLLLILFTIGTGLVFANTYAGALEPFPNLAGTAGGLFGTLQIAAASASLFIQSFFQNQHNELQVFGLAMFTLSTIALVTSVYLKKMRE